MYTFKSNINSYVKKLVAKSTNEEIEKEFVGLKDCYQRIAYAEKLLKEQGYLSNLKNLPKKLSKNNKTSEELRVSGNECYKQEKYKEALVKYNESLCYATENSPNLGIAFANRSAIYFKLEFYEKCLENIELAKNHNYKTSLMGKLKKREEQCLEILSNAPSKVPKDQNLINNWLKPKLPGNKKCNFYVADCLKVETSPEFGRHVVTNEDLKVGTVIAIEKPFASVVKPEKKYERCENCLKENLFSLLPCKTCPTVMYCSEECRDVAYRKFHKFECELHEIGLYDDWNQYNILQAMRIFYEALDICGTAEKLNEFSDSILDSEKHILDFDCSSADEDTKRKNDLHAFSTLVTCDKIGAYEFADVVGMMFIAINNCHCQLEGSSVLRATLSTETDRTLFRACVYKFMQIFTKNSVQLGYWTGATSIEYGNGLYLFTSLLNHSCAPNIKRLPRGEDHYLIVVVPIKSGQQICIDYGYTHVSNEIQQRQSELFASYYFKCNCEACLRNYGTLWTLQAKDKSYAKKYSMKNILGLSDKNSLQNISQTYEEICKYVDENYIKNYPCQEMCYTDVQIVQCLQNFIDYEDYWNGKDVRTN